MQPVQRPPGASQSVVTAMLVSLAADFTIAEGAVVIVRGQYSATTSHCGMSVAAAQAAELEVEEGVEARAIGDVTVCPVGIRRTDVPEVTWSTTPVTVKLERC